MGVAMRSLRATLAFLCGVLCVTGLVFGVVFAYSSRTFFNPTKFSERAADSLTQPAVAGIVADQITDQIIAANRDLTAYRPMVRGATEYVVASAPFRAVVRRAAKRVHQTIISETGKDIALTLADLGVVLRNALSMYPEIAEKVPEKAQVALGDLQTWPAGQRLARLLQFGHRLRMRAIVWPSIGLLMGVCGALLARRKDRYLVRVGLGLAITAAVVGAVAKYGGAVLAAFASSPTASDLIRGLWPAFVGPLALRMLILVAIGLVTVAGVTSLFQKVDLGSIARKAWNHLGNQPGRTHWKVLHAFLFIIVGILVILNPTDAMEALAILLGCVLFFVGIQELFSVSTRALPRVQAAIDSAAESKGSAWPRIALVGTLALLLAGAGAYWLARSDDTDAMAATTPIDACNGHPGLCDKKLNEVAFATTHNSMAAADIPTWMFPNQERGIPAQLQDGIRGFLIDVHYGVPVGDRIKTELQDEQASMKKYEETLGVQGVDAAMRIRNRLVGAETGPRDLYLGHGFCELGAELLVEVLEKVRDFLIENPNEVIIIVIQDEGVTPADVAAAFAKSGLEEFVYQGGVTPPWPTLREMIASDQRVVVFAEHQAEGVPWYHLVWDAFQETPYRFLKPEEMSNKPGRGGTKGSLLLMNNWIETTPAPLPSNALLVNSYDALLKRARACKRERKMMPNLIAVDFYRTGDLVRVVDTMNGIKQLPIAPLPRS
jgi:hypothetical protein